MSAELIEKVKEKLGKEREKMGGPEGKGVHLVVATADGPASLNIVEMLIQIVEAQAKEIDWLNRAVRKLGGTGVIGGSTLLDGL